MALPRKGILIRLAIYVPLILFFGWQALDRFLSEREPTRTVDETQKKLDQLPPEKFKTFTLPDGTVTKVPVLTPEEAEEIYGVPVQPAPGEAKEPEAERAKTPQPGPSGPGMKASGPPRD